MMGRIESIIHDSMCKMGMRDLVRFVNFDITYDILPDNPNVLGTANPNTFFKNERLGCVDEKDPVLKFSQKWCELLGFSEFENTIRHECAHIGSFWFATLDELEGLTQDPHNDFWKKYASIAGAAPRQYARYTMSEAVAHNVAALSYEQETHW